MGKKPLPAQRLRMKREGRLQSAKHWLGSYKGKCVIRGYSNWYGVDYLCAIKELEMLSVPLNSARKSHLETAVKERAKQRAKRKEESALGNPIFDSDDNFSFIAGYTPGGFPYGLTCEERDPNSEWDESDSAHHCPREFS